MDNPQNNRFKEVRLLLNLTQSEFADKINMKQGTISDIERNRIGVSNKVASALITLLDVNELWFYTGTGEPFKGDILKVKSDNKKSEINTPSKIGTIRKETFADQLSKEDQNLIIALKELPELSDMLKDFINEFSIEEIENVSAIGAVWRQGFKWNNLYSLDKDQNPEQYELNMKFVLDRLNDYKKSIINVKEIMVKFLKTVKPLDYNKKINLPSKYLD